MNIVISEVYNQASDAKKGEIDIRPTISFVPGLNVEVERTGKNKDDWYITLQEIFEKKPFEDVLAKFGMVGLLLGGQGKKDFMRFKNTVTEGFVTSDITVSIAASKRDHRRFFKIALSKFKKQLFKDFVARHQVNYPQ